MAKFDLDDKLIRRLAALLEETGLSEIEYEAEGRRIRVGRGSGAISTAILERLAPAAPPRGGPAAEALIEGEKALAPGTVTSPMVGTVYVAAEPGAPPLIKVGDIVQEGQTLLIIEAMKVMNPLASPHAGTVIGILVGDGQPVEFGEPLLVIE